MSGECPVRLKLVSLVFLILGLKLKHWENQTRQKKQSYYSFLRMTKMSVPISWYFNQKLLKQKKCQRHGGDSWNIMIVCTDYMAIHLTVFWLFLSGLKWWTSQLTEWPSHTLAWLKTVQRKALQGVKKSTGGMEENVFSTHPLSKVLILLSVAWVVELIPAVIGQKAQI